MKSQYEKPKIFLVSMQLQDVLIASQGGSPYELGGGDWGVQDEFN